MDGDVGEDGLTKLGVARALCREYAADERAFLGFVAESMQRALGADVEISYGGGFLKKKTINGVTLISGDNRYTLEDPGHGPLHAKITHVVRGIALKTESVDVETWVELVSEIMERKTAQHSAARQALQKMLGLS